MIRKLVAAIYFVLALITLASPTFAAPAGWTGPVFHGQVRGTLVPGVNIPLPSGYPYDTYVQLYRHDFYAPVVRLNETDCKGSGQGCADPNGNYEFWSDVNGNQLVLGELYQVVASAQGHIVDRFWFRWDDENTVVPQVLQLVPFLAEYKASTPRVPSAGGNMSIVFTTRNLGAQFETVPVYATIYAPGSITPDDQYQIRVSDVVVPTGLWKTGTGSVDVPIPSYLPDGFSICVRLKFGPLGRPYSWFNACIEKGPLPGEPIG